MLERYSIDDSKGAETTPRTAGLKKGSWTAAEDAILKEYMKKHGEGNWNAVQKNSGLNRCGKSRRLRWANHLRPNLKKGVFTPEEELVIFRLHAQLGNKWARIAAHLPGRTDNEIKNYWNMRIKRRLRAELPLYPQRCHLRLCMLSMKKGPWMAEEDAILIEYVKKHGEGYWNVVQKNRGLNRCGKSCRLRWANHLRPNLKKGVFTPEEELVILRLHAQLGNKWARIAAHLPGRTDNEIKNYWNMRIKRRLRAELPLYPQRCHLRLRMLSLKKGPWTAAEDAILIEYVKKHGEGNWNAVQKNSGLNRCGKSCRLRWANHFRPNLKKGVFTPEEELVFLRLHAQLGNKWARIAAHLPGGLIMRSRTTGTCGLRGGCGAELPLYPQDSNYNSML